MKATPKDTIIYKIRRKSDGLFSSGGTGPRFSATGKVWTTLGALKNHLNLLEKNGARHYQDCEIIPIKVVYRATTALPISDFIEERQRLNQEKQRRIKEESRLEKEARDRAELARLKQLYEGDPLRERAAKSSPPRSFD